MSIVDGFLQELDYEAVQTRKMLARVPDDKFDWQPHAKSMTLGRLAGHIAESPKWAEITAYQDTFVLDGSYQPPQVSTQEELLEFFDENVAKAKEAMKSVSDEKMSVTWRMVRAEGELVFEMPRAGVFRTFIMNHLIHHRGQLSVYLRLLDVPVPAIYGPSADEQG